MGLRQQPCTSSSYWWRESLAPPNPNGPNNKRRGRELTALRALLPAMRRCLSTAGMRSPRRRHRMTWVKCRAATRSTSQMVGFRLSPTALIMREALWQRSPMREPHSTLSHLRVDMDPTRDLALTLAPLPLAPTQEGDSDQDAPHYLLSFVNNVNISLE